MGLTEILEILNTVVFTFGDRSVTVFQILVVPLLVLVGFMTIRWSERWLSRKLTARGVNADLIHLMRRVFLVVAIAVLVVTTLDLLNVPITAFAFVSGAVAIGVGFGAQNILNNFISGWILMWERPIRIGDFLEVADTRGTVEAINTRSTRIRRVDGVHLLVPNSFLLENTVVNWTLVDRLTRSVVRVGVAYGSPAKRVAELITRAATEHPDVLEEPGPSVFFEDFGDSALIFDLLFWMESIGEKELRRTRSDIRFRIDELFAEAGIVIAFPQQDVHLDGVVRLLPAE
ncbi:MAG: mechanosensitive ion channel [Pseudomonadales bacterium]